MRRALLVLGALLGVAGLLLTLSWVHSLATYERDYRGPLLSLGEQDEPAVTLGRLPLVRGQSVSFSVCSSDGFEPGAWKRADFVIYHHEPTEQVLRVTLDETRLATRRSGPEGACVDLARTSGLTGQGDFSVALETRATRPGEAPAAVRGIGAASTRLWTHVTAVSPLRRPSMMGPLVAWLGILILTVGWLVPAPKPSEFEQLAAAELAQEGQAAPELTPTHPGRPLAIALVGLLLAFGLSAVLPPSPLTPMGGALVLFVGQLLLAVVLMRDPARLALTSPAKWPWLLLLMPVLGVLVRIALAPLSQLVPSTGVAPIEQLVSAPSGMLTMLAIGLVAPFAEELFFRGLVFRLLEDWRGRVFAAGLSALLFALVHVPQAFGAWPSFVSIACAGVVFSVVRALTGSTVASILAHLGYNGVIALPVVITLLMRG